MEDYLNSKGLCHVCREELTAINAEVAPGLNIFVCEKCLESAKQNFIWICVHCGNVYIRPKSLVLKRLIDPGLKRAYRQCDNLQIIQGIDQCIECAPDEIAEFVATAKSEKNGGHC
jgi:predicted amidophosphoribosyltransferase